MKKLFLALFMLAFVTVSFSAPVFKPVEKEVKKELVKSFEIEKAVSAVMQVTVESKDFVYPVNIVFSDESSTGLKTTSFEKSYLYTNPDYNDYWLNRFSVMRNTNKEKPHISG